MSLVLNTNVTSLIAQRQLTINSKNQSQAMLRLSSGLRINRTSDDAAGSSISANLTSQIRRLNQASRNVQDGTGVLETAEGSLSVITDNLQRIRELTVQAANDTNDAASRSSISTEVRTLLADNDRITASTQLGGLYLLNGSITKAPIQVGSGSDPTTNSIDISSVLTSTTSADLGIVGTAPKTFPDITSISLDSNAKSLSFLTDIDTAINAVNSRRAGIGAYQNDLESTDQNLSDSIINFSASNSRIRDVDIAAETSNMTQSQILTQASTMILSQTNDLPKMILDLLQK